MYRQLKNYFALIFILMTSSLCRAQADLNMPGDLRIEKNQPTPQEFTNTSEQILQLKELLKITQVKNNSQGINSLKKIQIQPSDLIKKNGGISDGGGNAVGQTLFDFYENEGSYLVKSLQILNWNVELQQLIQKANLLLPRVRMYSKRGLGDELILSIRAKKWILETKEITNDSCHNDSLIQVLNQKIVGCQNFYEVRLSADWMINHADHKNQAGLIIHEALLAWIRDLDKGTSKSDSEFKVREINRLLNSDLNSAEFVEEIKKLLPAGQYYNIEEHSFIESLPAKVLKVKSNFCTSQTIENYNEVMSLYQAYPSAHDIIDDSFKDYLKVVRLTTQVQSIKKLYPGKTVDEKNLAEAKSEYCAEHKNALPDTSKIIFKPELITGKCKKNLESAFGHYTSIQDKIKHGLLNGSGDSAFLLSGTNSLVQSSALFCSGLKGIELQRKLFMTEDFARKAMAEVQIQAIKYYTILKEDFDKNN